MTLPNNTNSILNKIYMYINDNVYFNKIYSYYDTVANFLDYSLTNLILLIIAIIIVYFLFRYIIQEYFTKTSPRYNKINVNNLKRMEWDNFELLVRKIFIKKGYSAKRIGGHGSDGGIDLIIKKNPLDKKSIIQCKKYNNTVGVSVVREMYAVGIHNDAKNVYIYTTANFSKPAYEFAKNKNIILVDGEHVLSEIKKYIPYRYYSKYFLR